MFRSENQPHAKSAGNSAFNAVLPGDKVRLITSSGSVAHAFPHIVKLAQRRLSSVFGLKSDLSLHCMNPEITMEQRAQDLHEAFQDSTVKAVFSMIGGNSQISLIPYLKDKVFESNPKPFFGFSDNTNLTNFLFKLGVPSFYGAAILTQFGMSYRMHSETISGIEWALRGEGWFELKPSQSFTEDEIDWRDPESFGKKRRHLKNSGTQFLGESAAEGQIWGGCIESLADILKCPERLPSPEQIRGSILALESSEEIPTAACVEKFMEDLGKIGILKDIAGIAHARPKAAFLGVPDSLYERTQYRLAQTRVVKEIALKHNPKLVIASNLDFGHTDPQYPLPIGGVMRIEPSQHRVFVHKK